MKYSQTPANLYPFFSIFNEAKSIFINDPNSIFTIGDNYLVTCRDIEDVFHVYSLSSFARLKSVVFHKVIIYNINFLAKL